MCENTEMFFLLSPLCFFIDTLKKQENGGELSFLLPLP